MSACAVDWGLVADWLTVGLTGATLLLAYWALNAWQAQLQGTSRHAVAQEVLTAARALQYAYYDARNPFIDASEFPEGRGWNDLSSDHERAGWQWHVYSNRLKDFWPYAKALFDLRPKAGAVLGDPTADAIQNLAKRARDLSFYMQHHRDVLRAGDGVAQWGDQGFVAKVRRVLAMKGTDEPISNEFEAAMGDLSDLLKNDLELRAKQRRMRSSFRSPLM